MLVGTSRDGAASVGDSRAGPMAASGSARRRWGPSRAPPLPAARRASRTLERRPRAAAWIVGLCWAQPGARPTPEPARKPAPTPNRRTTSQGAPDRRGSRAYVTRPATPATPQCRSMACRQVLPASSYGRHCSSKGTRLTSVKASKRRPAALARRYDGGRMDAWSAQRTDPYRSPARGSMRR
jgi:hypothetical protein